MPATQWYEDTKTKTWVPRHARALADVVRAFEDCDTVKLTEALDAADPALLNHLPKVQSAPWLPTKHNEHAWCFFNAWRHPRKGLNPLSLLSCATWVMVNHVYDFTNLVGRADDMNAFFAVYRVLVNHPKVDINAHTPHVDTCREYQRLAAECVIRNDDVDECRVVDDNLPAFDYAMQALIECEREEDCDHLCEVAAILVRSGKLNVDRNIASWNQYHYIDRGDNCVLGYCWNYGELTYKLFQEVLKRYDASLKDARRLLPALRVRIRYGRSDYMDREIAVSIGKRLEEHQRGRVLAYVRRVARTRILLGRAWKEAIEESYKPGGAGAKRARHSFESWL